MNGRISLGIIRSLGSNEDNNKTEYPERSFPVFPAERKRGGPHNYFYIRRVRFLKEHTAFICILLTCALLRFLPLFDYQFTYDELSGMERTQFGSFGEVMEKGVKIDAHPALIQLLIYYLTQWFGYVTWIIKLPFLLFSLGAVVYAYAFGLRNLSRQAGLLAASLLSFSFIFVFYAPVARMYIPGVFFSMGLLYHFFRIFYAAQTSYHNYVLLGLFAWLSALNQHINALFALTVCASGLFFLNRSTYKPYVIMCVLVILAYLPHLPVTLYQLSVPGIGRDAGGWLEAPEASVIFYFLKTLAGTGGLCFLWLAVMSLAWLLNRRLTLRKGQLFLLGIFLVNYLVIYLYSVWRSPVFQYSVMLFSATAFILFICGFIEFRRPVVFYLVLILLSSTLIYRSYFQKAYLDQCVKTVFEYQFERTVYYKKQLGEERVYPVFFDADAIMKKIYFEKYGMVFACQASADSVVSNGERVFYPRETDPFSGRPVPGATVSSLRLFSEFIAGLTCDYLILTSAMPLYQAVAAEHFPFLIENTQTQGINFRLYSKRAEDQARALTDESILYQSSPGRPEDFTYSRKDHLAYRDEGFRLSIDSLEEFPFAAAAELGQVLHKEGQVLLASVKVKVRDTYSPMELCLSLNDPEMNTAYAYNARAAADFRMGPDSAVRVYSEYFNGTRYKQAGDNARLTAYLWNRGREHLLLDDFSIRVIDYWPGKWALWD